MNLKHEPNESEVAAWLKDRQVTSQPSKSTLSNILCIIVPTFLIKINMIDWYS